MTRIAMVEPDGAGGLVHYAYQLADALAETGADVTLHTARRYELAHLPHRAKVRAEMRLWPAIPAALSRRPVAALGRKVRRAWRGARYFVEWRRLTRRLLAERPDVALFSTIRFPFQVLFLRRLKRAGITLAQVCHEFEPREGGWVSRSLAKRLGTAVYCSFDVVFLHGEQNRKAFLATFPVDPMRAVVIAHGNEGMFLRLVSDEGDLRSAYGLAPEVPVALFFGGLRPSKGVPDLIEAFAAVADRTWGQLLIVGHSAGVDPADLERQIAELELTGRATVDARYVPLTEVGPVMRTCDFVVLPYRSATASGILQLAYAFGRPVVATALGALAEDVAHGRTGLLVEPDDRDGLAGALEALLSNPARAERMGAAARIAADEEFGWAPIASTILSAIEEAPG